MDESILQHGLLTKIHLPPIYYTCFSRVYIFQHLPLPDPVSTYSDPRKWDVDHKVDEII